MPSAPSLWYRIAMVAGVINVLGIGYGVGTADMPHAAVHVALVPVIWFWARRARRGPSTGGSEIEKLREQLEQQKRALEEAQNTLSGQSSELAELQERVDFAERILAQARERQSLGPRDERG